MTNFKGISKLKKEKESEMKLETDIVNQYKEAILGLFRTVCFEMDSEKNKNSFYYLETISNFSNLKTREYQSNTTLNTIKEIELFHKITINLLKDIVQFFIAINNYDSHKNKTKDYIILSKINIEDGFKNLGQFDLKIKGDFSTKDSSIALKKYCLKLIKESVYLLNNNIYIDIEKCPLQSHYENLLFKLENSISSEEIESAELLFSNSKKRNIKFKDEKDILDFIDNVKDKTAFALELKDTFNIEKGIDFKIMIELLIDNKIFRISDRKFKLFHELALVYFDRNIGSYSGVKDKYHHTEIDKKAHPKKIRNINEKLQPLIDKYKIK